MSEVRTGVSGSEVTVEISSLVVQIEPLKSEVQIGVFGSSV